MNVAIHPRLAAFVRAQVEAGRFGSADEVVNGALARLEADAQISAAATEALRPAIAEGIEEADRGVLEPWDAEEVRAEVNRRAGAGGDVGKEP